MAIVLMSDSFLLFGLALLFDNFTYAWQFPATRTQSGFKTLSEANNAYLWTAGG